MPKAFTDCIKNGGRVFTVEIGKNKYRHGCEINGQTYYGEVKTKKKGEQKSKK